MKIVEMIFEKKARLEAIATNKNLISRTASQNRKKFTPGAVTEPKVKRTRRTDKNRTENENQKLENFFIFRNIKSFVFIFFGVRSMSVWDYRMMCILSNVKFGRFFSGVTRCSRGNRPPLLQRRSCFYEFALEKAKLRSTSSTQIETLLSLFHSVIHLLFE